MLVVGLLYQLVAETTMLFAKKKLCHLILLRPSVELIDRLIGAKEFKGRKYWNIVCYVSKDISMTFWLNYWVTNKAYIWFTRCIRLQEGKKKINTWASQVFFSGGSDHSHKEKNQRYLSFFFTNSFFFNYLCRMNFVIFKCFYVYVLRGVHSFWNLSSRKNSRR